MTSTFVARRTSSDPIQVDTPNEPKEPNRHQTAVIAMWRLVERVGNALSRKRSPKRTRRIQETVAASPEPLRPVVNVGARLTLRWVTGSEQATRHPRLLAAESVDQLPLVACWQMHAPETMDTLIALDLDVEVLEERTETPSFRHPLSPYACG